MSGAFVTFTHFGFSELLHTGCSLCSVSLIRLRVCCGFSSCSLVRLAFLLLV